MGVTVVIVIPVTPPVTFARFCRSCDFWTVVKVRPVRSAPTTSVFEKFVALVITAFERLTFDKSTFVRFEPDRLHAGPTINPPRSWKFVGRVTAPACACAGETICPELTPANVAPVKFAPEISAAVRLALVRFALVKLAFVSVVFERFTLVRFLFERMTFGPTRNPSRIL